MKLVTSNLYPHYTPDHCAFCVSRQFLHFFLIFSAHFNIQVCYTIHHKKISCRSLARWLSDSSRLSDKLQVVCVPVVRFFAVIGQATGRLRAGCPILRGYRTSYRSFACRLSDSSRLSDNRQLKHLYKTSHAQVDYARGLFYGFVSFFPAGSIRISGDAAFKGCQMVFGSCHQTFKDTSDIFRQIFVLKELPINRDVFDFAGHAFFKACRQGSRQFNTGFRFIFRNLKSVTFKQRQQQGNVCAFRLGDACEWFDRPVCIHDCFDRPLRPCIHPG